MTKDQWRNVQFLGWVLPGTVSEESKKPQLSSVNFVSTHVLKVATQTQHESSGTEELLHRLWDLDSIGIGFLQQTITYKIRHARRQAHYSRTGTSKQRPVKLDWLRSLCFNVPVRE